jgi:hypothetical protein
MTAFLIPPSGGAFGVTPLDRVNSQGRTVGMPGCTRVKPLTQFFVVLSGRHE